MTWSAERSFFAGVAAAVAFVAMGHGATWVFFGGADAGFQALTYGGSAVSIWAIVLLWPRVTESTEKAETGGVRE